jgi:hypothetical protein
MPMSLGLGLGLTRAGGPSGPAAPSLAPIGSQILFWGDGVMSIAAAIGMRNIPTHVRYRLNARVLPSPAWMQCQSGGDMDTTFARIGPAMGQQADIAVMASQGHNDPLMSTDPDSDSTYWDKWKRNLDAWVTGHPNAKLIPVCGTLASDVAGETTASSFDGGISRRQRVWNLQTAYVAAKADARVFYIDFSSWVPSANASDTGNVHPNNAGGKSGGDIIFDAIDSKIVAATKDEVMELLRLGTYPNVSGTNLHPDVLLAGTTGTMAGTVTPTGEYATGQRITNNLTNGTGVGVLCAKDAATNPNFAYQVVTVTGTNGAENTIVMDDTGNITLTGALKGQYGFMAMDVVIDDGAGGTPKGVWHVSLALGSYGSIGANIASNSATGAPIAHPIDCAMMSSPLVIFGAGVFSSNPGLTVRFDDIALTTTRIKYSRPIIRLISTPSQSPARYIGDDTILTTNALLRATGTITDAGGGNLTIEPGSWCPYGITFTQVRTYKGGGSGGLDGQTNKGAGTLLYTINNPTVVANWVQAVLAADVAAADTLYVEVDGISSVGSSYTARTNTAITVS